MHWHSRLYALQSYSRDHRLEDILRFRTLSVLDSRLLEQFNEYSIRRIKITLQRKRKRMMEVVGMTEKTYKRVFSYGKDSLKRS